MSNCLPSSESDEFSSVKARRCEDIGGIEKSRSKARLSHLGHTVDYPKKSSRNQAVLETQIMRRDQSAIEKEKKNPKSQSTDAHVLAARVVLVVAPETCTNVTCHLCNIPVVQSWQDPIDAMGCDCPRPINDLKLLELISAIARFPHL